MEPALERLKTLDRRLVQAAKSIKILSYLAWPMEVGETFLRNYQKRELALPQVELPRVDLSRQKEELQAIVKECDRQHPIGAFLHDTAKSYLDAAALLDNAGTPAFCDISIAMYGQPSDTIAKGPLTHLDAAEAFIKTTHDFRQRCEIKEEEICILPQTLVADLQQRIAEVFLHHDVKVELDPALPSKAAAGAYRIRVRTATCFSPMDLPQLAEHEAFVHTLTSLNGREQPFLTSLGLGSPRTTRTQEGIAIFAELITTSIDLQRLRRIALRVKAIHLAMEGADFLELFQFFLESGQTEIESYQSTVRVFRGGVVTGRYVFTKDAVYLGGLFEVNLFLRKSIQEEKLAFPHYLCAGRLTLGDILSLEPFFQSGLIAPPLYQPRWLNSLPALAAFLVYNNYLNQIQLNHLSLNDFRTPT